MPRSPALKILLRLDADSQIGMGHAVRSASLITALDRASEITLVGRGEALGQFFPRARVLPRWSHSIRGQKFELGLIDVASNCAAEVEAARDVCEAPLCVIDDFGSPCSADLIVNGTAPEEQHPDSSKLGNTSVLAGARYSLIRPCFAAARREPGEGTGVVIVAGSGQAAEHWLLTLLEARPDWASWGRVDVVVGAGFTDYKAVERLASLHGLRAHQGCTGEELACLLAGAGLAVLTSGMVMYEALACGVATLAFPHVQHTRCETEWFAKRDCLVDLGSDATPERVDRWVKRLRGCKPERTRLARNAAAAVDGLGLERVARAILDLADGAPRRGTP